MVLSSVAARRAKEGVEPARRARDLDAGQREQARQQRVAACFQPIDQAGTLSIRNPVGSVRIYGSDDSEMKLKTTKKAWSTSQLNANQRRSCESTSGV